MTGAPAAPSGIAVTRGSIWSVNLDPARGPDNPATRPAVVLSADGLNRIRRTVMIVPLSMGPAPRPPIAVPVPSAGQGSVAVCDQLRAVDRTRLAQAQGNLSGDDLRAVEDGIRAVLML